MEDKPKAKRSPRSLSRNQVRRLGSWIGVVLTGLLLALFILPTVVDLSHLLPQIQRQLDRQVNARLEFKSAHLSILPTLGLVMDDVVLYTTRAPFKGVEAIQAERMVLDLSFWRLLKGEFVGQVELSHPMISMLKSPETTNFATMIKSTETVPPGGGDPGKEKKSDQSFGVASLPEFTVTSVVIEDGTFSFRETLSTNDPFMMEITAINAKVEDFKPNRPFQIHLNSNVNISRQNLRIEGPITATLAPTLTLVEDGSFRLATEGMVELDELKIVAGEIFKKPAGVPLNSEFSASLTPNALRVSPVAVKVAGIRATGGLDMSPLKEGRFKAHLRWEEQGLESLADLAPDLAPLLKTASAALELTVQGRSNEPMAANGSGRIKSGDSDLQVAGTFDDVLAPKGRIELTSSRLDLDQILGAISASNSSDLGRRLPAPSAKKSEDMGSESSVITDHLRGICSQGRKPAPATSYRRYVV